ncbi:hypothetical protein M2160_001571 [Streptomyces sp. SAI-117]|nr:hypothetical protein [Streptomyces sp. SAI-117]
MWSCGFQGPGRWGYDPGASACAAPVASARLTRCRPQRVRLVGVWTSGAGLVRRRPRGLDRCGAGRASPAGGLRPLGFGWCGGGLGGPGGCRWGRADSVAVDLSASALLVRCGPYGWAVRRRPRGLDRCGAGRASPAGGLRPLGFGWCGGGLGGPGGCRWDRADSAAVDLSASALLVRCGPYGWAVRRRLRGLGCTWTRSREPGSLGFERADSHWRGCEPRASAWVPSGPSRAPLGTSGPRGLRWCASDRAGSPDGLQTPRASLVAHAAPARLTRSRPRRAGRDGPGASVGDAVTRSTPPARPCLAAQPRISSRS